MNWTQSIHSGVKGHLLTSTTKPCDSTSPVNKPATSESPSSNLPSDPQQRETAGALANPLDVQEGGGHYKDCPIQPIEYCMANRLDQCQSNIVKYVTRFRDKNGLEDLLKAKHYIDLLIYFEYGNEQEKEKSDSPRAGG